MNFHPSVRKVFDLLLPPCPARHRLSSAFVVCSIKHSRFPGVIERKLVVVVWGVMEVVFVVECCG
eukprot:3230626-Prymnesium_polylepis.2